MTDSQNKYDKKHLLIWAKTDQSGTSRNSGGPAWNPLLAHVLDVAAITGQIWDRYLPPTLRARLTEAFGASDPTTARKTTMLLAGLHDLGKGSNCFLRQFGTNPWDSPYLREARTVWEEQARDAGLPLSERLEDEPSVRHEHITAAHLPRLLGCTCHTCGGQGPLHRGLHTATALLGGHHGHIPGPDTIDRAAIAADTTAWLPTYTELVQDAADLIGIDLTNLPQNIRPERPSTLPLFAGLVILADWIASDETHFTYRPHTTSTHTWWRTSLTQAQAAADALLLDRWKPKPTTWSALYPGTSPRPFQAAAIAAMPAEGPALVIIESDTGSGKTRLALWCAHHLAITCGYQGLYMAMPTRAATNQTAQEIADFMKNALDEQEAANLAVVHGTAQATEFVHQLLDAARAPGQTAYDSLEDFIAPTMPAPGPRESHAVLSPWYLRRCLGLIAPFAVGTIDQAVLATQPSRHWTLRLLGLATKTLIIDEAHAYELYQQGLLEAVLQWLADAGASIVVLSATLPISARTALTAAWCTGHRVQPQKTDQTGPITIVDSHGTVTRTGPPARPPKLRTRINFQPDPGAPTLAKQLLHEARGGGITVVLRNRVSKATELHASLTEQAPDDGWRPEEIILLHGRTLPRYRLPIEEQLKRTLGPGSHRPHPNPERPRRLLVIATQVVEQSLDIDFDRIYTDLAPIDLLLQRRGRVHRHTANNPFRPAWAHKPRMTILIQPGPDGLPLVEPPSPKGGHPLGNLDGYIYAPYTLATTWHTLNQRLRADGSIRITTPTHTTELIESVYGQQQTANGPLGQLLNRTWNSWQTALTIEKSQYTARAFTPFTRRGKPTDVQALASGNSHGDGDDGGLTGIRAVSRLGDPSIDAIALYQQSNGALTYDPAGTHRADLSRHPADTPAHRQQQKDFLLNTMAIPAHWFTGKNALPPPEVWPPARVPALKKTHTVLLDPASGKCVSGPIGLTLSSITGLTKAPPVKVST
ncbi:CRISPR-associated helicase Cas3' [Streptomyces sp. NPDC049916]|uniref:CRISPR-associated helicase Cas3' n=1 Tax=Streptomyces sp. NPDC049916 TaxID=3155156 RepID=UPI00341A8CDD